MLSGNLARRYRRGKDDDRARAAFKQAANLHQLAGDVEAAKHAEAEAVAGPARSWGLGRWFAIAAGIAIGILVAMIALAVAFGAFEEF